MQKTKQPGKVSTENGLSYAVRIEATFGSQFQRTVAIRNLNRMLAAWKELVEAQHKKNTITVIRSRDSGRTRAFKRSDLRVVDAIPHFELGEKLPDGADPAVPGIFETLPDSLVRGGIGSDVGRVPIGFGIPN
jgi:hypothetical protein